MKAGQIMPGQIRLILCATAVHVIAWFAYYAQIPIGRFPTPEEAGYLEAAQLLAAGDAVAAPTLYMLLLSLCERFAGTESGMTLAARTVNAIFMVLGTGFCAAAAGRLWKKNRAVWIGGLLAGLNPVLVFWAGHIGPTLPAFGCLAFAVWRGLRALRRPAASDILWTGAGLALAAAFEPGLLGLLPVWPFALLFAGSRHRARFAGIAAVPVALFAAVVLLTPLHLPLAPSIDTDQLPERAYALFNNFEFFAGKSYSLFNWSEIFLLLNPIHWGLVLILAAAGAYARFKNGNRGRSIYLLLGGFVLFAAGYLLLDLTSRERIIVLPLLAIPAGGAGYLPQIWRHAGRRTRRTLAVGALALGALTYSNLYDLRDESRLRADYRHLAIAHLALGLNEGATLWAGRALEIDPNPGDLKYIIARARFNEWALAADPRSLPVEATRARLDAVLEAEVGTPAMATLEAIYRWKLRQNEAALEIWEAHRDTEPLALLCLTWIGQADPPSDAHRAFPDHPDAALLREALRVDRNTLGYGEIEQRIDNLLAYAY